MGENLSAFLSEKENIVSEQLVRKVTELSIPARLKDSMLYSIKAGGKRLRPLLMIASCESYHGTYQQVLSIAVALEMIHTYSLIHDDLPAMDDDHFRRGQPTNHRVFDEATAILAGDALLTYSFETIANDMQLTDEQKVYIIRRLSEASGPSGMVAGQSLDMEAENQQVNLEELEEIHNLKTGKLLSFALEIGAYVGGASANQIKEIRTFGYYVGLVFQVQDDILDVSGDPEKIGKPIGSDESNFKSTYPKLLGLDGAIKQKQQYVEKAKAALNKADVRTTILDDLINYLNTRDI